MKMAVYVARSSARPGQIKIGISRNPEGRRATLAAQCKGRVWMPTIIWLEERAARTLERDAHWQLTMLDAHVEGEWFLGTPQTGVWAIYTALREQSGDWISGPPSRGIPLIEWGIGHLTGRKRVAYDWEMVNASLAEIERGPFGTPDH